MAALVTACASPRFHNRLDFVLDRMSQMGYSFNADLLQAMMTALVEAEELEKAKELWTFAEEAGVVPSTKTRLLYESVFK